MSLTYRIFSILGYSVSTLLPVAAMSETYFRATVGARGELQVVTSARRTIRPRRIPGQVGFSAPRIAPDGRTVGWLTLHPNSTSYPVPLVLVLYRGDRILRTFRGDGTPIWRWAFQAHGRRVAFSQQPTHGPYHPHCELRNTETGRLIAAYDGEPTNAAPRWARRLAHGG